ncbi:unnamed protein product [Phytophthora lilii]|uniref:Unnamed protein product n=1 Tax=Phytophthora lilii TaxID=2077276 RepID=A0A9W6X7L4_9STRA|nr:unnamed protein product [Phytophthora lilii]
MPSFLASIAASLACAALLVSTANAHQKVLQPEPQWTNKDQSTWMNPLAFLEGQGYHPDQDFNGWRARNGYKSLRDFMDRAKYTVTPGADQTCGWTNPKGTPQPIPKGGVVRSTGFTHDGPCAVYLDDVMVLEHHNCHESIPGKDYPIDFSSCEKKGSCTLYWFWLGVRFVKSRWSWQVYKECIPITAGGGAATGGVAQGQQQSQPQNQHDKMPQKQGQHNEMRQQHDQPPNQQNAWPKQQGQQNDQHNEWSKPQGQQQGEQHLRMRVVDSRATRISTPVSPNTDGKPAPPHSVLCLPRIRQFIDFHGSLVLRETRCGYRSIQHGAAGNSASNCVVTGTPVDYERQGTKYNPLAFLENQGFATQEDFRAWRTQNGYKTLRDFMDNAKYTVTEGVDFSCGWINPKGTPQPIPAGGAMRSTGYTHDGSCEVWLDDKRVLQGDNYHETTTGKDYTIDYSSCQGSCTLRWYWLGVRFLKNAYSWQVYKACIPLTSGSTTEQQPLRM